MSGTETVDLTNRDTPPAGVGREGDSRSYQPGHTTGWRRADLAPKRPILPTRTHHWLAENGPRTGTVDLTNQDTPLVGVERTSHRYSRSYQPGHTTGRRRSEQGKEVWREEDQGSLSAEYS